MDAIGEYSHTPGIRQMTEKIKETETQLRQLSQVFVKTVNGIFEGMLNNKQ